MHYLTSAFLACLLLLVGCASPQPTAYKQASSDNEMGYTETRLTDSLYRIDFEGNRFTDKTRIKDYAMLRAAELTMQKGYDWFAILDSETNQETKTRPQTDMSAATGTRTVQKCGLLGCATYGSPSYSGLDIETYEVEGKVSTSLQISMGKGDANNPSSVFNAKELANNIRKNLQ